jgi:hypothetical protein
MKRILIPIVSSITAIVVGIASALIAIQLTTPAAPATIQAPILAPTTVDGVPAPGLEASSGLSRVTGEGTVVDPAGVEAGADPLPDDVAAAVAALDAEDGMDAPRAHEIVGGAGGEPSSPADDPCAATPPPADADCPDGLRSVVFADTYIPDIEMYLIPNPGTDPTGVSIYCDPSDVTGPGILINAATTIPATITLNVFPTDDPSAGFDVTLDSPAAHDTQWRRAGGNSTDRYVNSEVFQHCTQLTDLLPHTMYSVIATAHDTYGRLSRLFTASFDSDGPPTKPDLEVVPLNDNILYASAPFDSRYSTPVIKAWVVAPGDPTDCTSYAGAIAQLRQYRPQNIVPVSAEYLSAHHFDPNFRSRVSVFYTVPEGSTIVVCARTFNATAPSWDAANPIRQQFVTLQTPDQVMPIVTLTGIDYSRDTSPSSVSLGAFNSSGVTCSPDGVTRDWAYPVAAQSSGAYEPLSRVLCDPTAQSAYAASQGFNGRIVITTEVHNGSEVLNSSYLLSLARYACTGNCALPPTLTFDVPLARTFISRPLQSCSNPFGCDYPPMPDGSTGTAHLTVSWVQGNISLARGWTRSEVDSTLPDVVQSDYPQLNLSNRVRPGLAADGFSGSANYILQVDRAVDYTATLSGDCAESSARTVLTGRLQRNSGTDLFFSGLCPGARYSLTIDLVADDGHHAIYSPTRLATDWHSFGGSFTMPQRSLDIDMSIELRSTGYRADQWWTSGADATVDDLDLSVVQNFPQTCFPDVAGSGGTRTLAGTVPQERNYHLTVQAGVITEGLYHGVNHDADCGWESPNWRFIDLAVDLTDEQLRAGVSYRQALNDEYIMTVIIRGTVVPEAGS